MSRGGWAIAAAVWLLGTGPLDAAGRVEQIGEVRVVFLEGKPYDIGRQHGELLRESVERLVADVLGYFHDYLKTPLLGPWIVNRWLDSSWGQSLPHVPTDYFEELQGLSDGSGVPLPDLWRLHAIPDRTYACANFAAWGRATADGRLIHARNLDWNIEAGVQREPVVFIVNPQGKRAFANFGWAGFIGVLSGVNQEGISIGQVGAETADISYRGIPMPLLMRRVMEESATLDDAVGIITTGPRTAGINYLIADAQARRAVVIETTHRFATVFEADDPKEHSVEYARPVHDAVFRADTAMDPLIRERQMASGGQPTRSGLEPPTGSAYETRYLGQAAGVMAHFGALDVPRAQEIAKAIAPGSNIQSVIFAWPDAFVANAQESTRAAYLPYHPLPIRRLVLYQRLASLPWEPEPPNTPLLRYR